MKNILIYIWLVLAGVMAVPVLNAQENNELNDYLEQAAENNPGLQAGFYSYYAALEKVPQVGALPNPNAMLAYAIQPVETRLGARVFDVQLSQSFPWFGTLKAKKGEAFAQAEAQYQVFLAKKNELFYQVKSAYYHLYAAHKSVAITEEYLGILEKDERLALSRVEAGRTSLSDVLRVQMEMKETRVQLDFYKDQKETLVTDFNALLNRPLKEPVSVGETLPALSLTQEYETLLDSVLQHNPELNRLHRENAALETKMKVAQKSGMPSFDLGVTYGNIRARTDMDMADNGRDVIVPMATISIPLYRKKYKALTREADLQRQSVAREIADTQNLLEADLVSAINQYKDTQRKVNLYDELLIQARQTLNILTAAYAGGEEGYEEVLRMEQQLLKYQLALENSRATLSTSIALIEKLWGKDTE